MERSQQSTTGGMGPVSGLGGLIGQASATVNQKEVVQQIQSQHIQGDKAGSKFAAFIC